jgi:hypothetical protein
VVDVFGAFSRADVRSLLDSDAALPNLEGQRLWAATTAQVIFP